MVRVSLIATVRNEEQSIGRLLDSLAAQTRPPDEMIFVDGGSSDGTVPLLESFAAHSPVPVRVLVEPGCNISRGRNVAIEPATGDVIACTDAGVRLAPNWLADLIVPFEAENPPAVVSGFFLPDSQTVFEVAMGATVLPVVADVDPRKFLPSSRSIAFRKAAWRAAGGYPEWLDYCEDLIFDFRLRDLYGPFPFVPSALAYFRPRPTLHALWKQYYRYARGDGKADLWRKRHAIRYLIYLVAGPLLFVLGLIHSLWWWALLALGGLVYCWMPYRRLWPALAGFGWLDRIKAVLWVPLIRVAGDWAKMVGYPVGWVWRLRHRRTMPELHWRRR